MRTLVGRVARRFVVVVAMAFAVAVVTAAPASAHTLSGPKPTNYRARIVSVTPPAPGVSVRVIDLGAKVELTNRTGRDVIVLGYEGEQYLRVGPRGVFENVHSSATYVNRSLKGGVIPGGVNTSPDAAPQWRKISDGRTARWHDHRAHRMQPGLPPQVASDPAAFHHVAVDHVKFLHDGTTSDATLTLDWVPGPSGVRWIPVAAVALLLGLALALVARWSRALAVAVGLLVAVDAAHAIAYEVARPGSNAAKTVQFLGGTFVSIFVWIAAVPTIIGLWRRRTDALYGAIFVGLMVALVGGASDLSALWHSQLPAVGPDVLTRLEGVLALGLGGGVALGSLGRALVSEKSDPSTDGAGSDGGWLSTLVVGLDDSELRRIAADLDVDEVLAAALPEFAGRLRECPDAFRTGALAFDIAADDDTGRHRWSIAPRAGDVVAERGRTEPAGAELALPFPVLLQLLAGTLSLEAATASGRVAARGDAGVIVVVAPYFAERGREARARAASARRDDRASAS
jgi:hypothetical protein